jgi:hypothetical protein
MTNSLQDFCLRDVSGISGEGKPDDAVAPILNGTWIADGIRTMIGHNLQTRPGAATILAAVVMQLVLRIRIAETRGQSLRSPLRVRGERGSRIAGNQIGGV